MDDILHEFLNKLRIISKIKPGQRLSTIDDLNIYVEGYFQWLKRKYYYDGKDTTARVLLDLYRSIYQYTEQLINEITNTKSENIKQQKITTAINLAEKISTSIKGLENLTKTYNNYPKTRSAIEGIVCDYAIVIFKLLMKNIPVHNRKLSCDIKYMGDVIYIGDGEGSDNIGDINDIGNDELSACDDELSACDDEPPNNLIPIGYTRAINNADAIGV